jgi:hypothetical protein
MADCDCAMCGMVVERRRSTRIYCATACRMRAYRLRRNGLPRRRLPIPNRAHQARASGEADIATATVRPIPLSEARAIIERYEWLGTMPAVSRMAFGIFFGERCGGAVVFGDEYAENRGVWDRYGFTGKIIGLLRGACLPWAHPARGLEADPVGSSGLRPTYLKVPCFSSGCRRTTRGVLRSKSRIDGGTARPSALAVLRFTAISYFTGN